MAKERSKGTVKEVSESELKTALSEKREHERMDAALEIDLPLTNVEQLRRVYTTNISKGGLLFTIAAPATMPAVVDLTLALPDGSKVTLHSEVRHVKRREGASEFEVGVQFSELDKSTRDTIEGALAQLTRK